MKSFYVLLVLPALLSPKLSHAQMYNGEYKQYDLANFLMNRYMEHSDETDGLVLLPLFMSLRASIRAMIIATQSANSSDPTARKQYHRDAENYLNLAFKLLKRPKTKLVVIGVLSGSGKSTLATALAPYKQLQMQHGLIT